MDSVYPPELPSIRCPCPSFSLRRGRIDWKAARLLAKLLSRLSAEYEGSWRAYLAASLLEKSSGA